MEAKAVQFHFGESADSEATIWHEGLFLCRSITLPRGGGEKLKKLPNLL